MAEKAPVDIAVDAYRSGFVQRFGTEPHIVWAKDKKLLKAMVASYGLPRVLGLLEQYLDSDDEFIIQGGYTIGILSLKLNSLIVQGGNARTKLPARTKANLAAHDEARRLGPPKSGSHKR